MRSRITSILFGLTLLSPLTQAAPHAHPHGTGTLDIAVEATRITIRFDTPLDNLVGFERAPRTDQERREVDAAVARFSAAATLFTVDPVARCQLRRVELSSAALKLGHAGATATPGTAAASGHAELDASIEFDCVDAAKAGYIDHGLFAFTRLQRLLVQVAAPGRQLKRDLKRPAGRIALAR